MDALRGQDIVVAAGLFALRDATADQAELSRALGTPRSRVSESVGRLAENGIYSYTLGGLRSAGPLDFLVHGLPWMFPARPGEVVQGTPTSLAGPVLDELIASSQPYVWPSEGGRAHGHAVEPVHRLVLRAALTLPEAYPILSLADGIRLGRVREKRLAAEALEAMLHPDALPPWRPGSGRDRWVTSRSDLAQRRKAAKEHTGVGACGLATGLGRSQALVSRKDAKDGKRLGRDRRRGRGTQDRSP